LPESVEGSGSELRHTRVALAEKEFMTYLPNDDNRKFTELYGVHRLKSSFIPTNSQVYISTIQRLYSVLRGTELDESAELENPKERWLPKEPQPVGYNPNLPIEFFDFVVIDECHRWSSPLLILRSGFFCLFLKVGNCV